MQFCLCPVVVHLTKAAMNTEVMGALLTCILCRLLLVCLAVTSLFCCITIVTAGAALPKIYNSFCFNSFLPHPLMVSYKLACCCGDKH